MYVLFKEQRHQHDFTIYCHFMLMLLLMLMYEEIKETEILRDSETKHSLITQQTCGPLIQIENKLASQLLLCVD